MKQLQRVKCGLENVKVRTYQTAFCVYDCILVRMHAGMSCVTFSCIYYLLITKCAAWVIPRIQVNSLILWPLIKLARLGSDLMKCVHPDLGSNYLPMLYGLIPSAFQNTSCIFLFLSKSAACELAHHESSTQDECLGFKTSAPFSSAIESQRSCITSMLLAPPGGNSHLSGEIARCSQVNGEIICVHTFYYSTTFRVCRWPYF